MSAGVAPRPPKRCRSGSRRGRAARRASAWWPRPRPCTRAMFLAATMIALAVLYIVQDALFLGVVQVVVYTGAVMMLFLFVLMLIGVDSAESLVETIRGQRCAALCRGRRVRRPADRRHRQRLGRRLHRAGRGQRRRQRRRPRGADLHPLPVGVRADRRAADHRRARRDGAGPPRTLRARARPSASCAEERFRPGGHRPRCRIPVSTPGTTPWTSPALLPDGSGSELSVARCPATTGPSDVQASPAHGVGGHRRPPNGTRTECDE